MVVCISAAQLQVLSHTFHPDSDLDLRWPDLAAETLIEGIVARVGEEWQTTAELTADHALAGAGTEIEDLLHTHFHPARKGSSIQLAAPALHIVVDPRSPAELLTRRFPDPLLLPLAGH